MNWTGLAAQAWEPAGGDEAQPDYAFIRQILEGQRGPALDIGCGTGRLLLRLLRDGFDVDGVDTSQEMLAICRDKARRMDIIPGLFWQAMQKLELPRRYQTIFIACGAFCLVTDLAQAWETLVRINAHLEDDGVLAFNVIWPFAYREPLSVNPLGRLGEWEALWSHPQPDGTTIAEQFMRLRIDRVEQLLIAKRRYQWLKDGVVQQEEVFDANVRWYYKHEMILMLEKTGFHDVQVKGDWSNHDFSESHTSMVFIARH